MHSGPYSNYEAPAAGEARRSRSGVHMPQVLGQRLAMKPGIDLSLQAASGPRSHGTGTSFSALELAYNYCIYSVLSVRECLCVYSVVTTGMANPKLLQTARGLRLMVFVLPSDLHARTAAATVRAQLNLLPIEVL